MMPGLPGLRGYDTATTVAMSKEEASVFLSSLLRHQQQENQLAKSSETKAITGSGCGLSLLMLLLLLIW